MGKDNTIAPTLFGTDAFEVGTPIFEHSYVKPCTFLGTFEDKDLYHCVLHDGTPMLIERSGNGSFEFIGESAKTVVRCYLMDNELPLGEAYRRAEKLKLKLN